MILKPPLEEIDLFGVCWDLFGASWGLLEGFSSSKGSYQPYDDKAMRLSIIKCLIVRSHYHVAYYQEITTLAYTSKRKLYSWS